LPGHIAVAAVANFPHGGSDVQAALRDVGAVMDSGAQEIDLVLPHAALRQGDEAAAARLLHAVRQACPGLLLKVILETGELREDALIERACRLALDAGADFLKTSTGKTPVSATPHAARLLLGAIRAHAGAATRVGFKPSGGLRTVADVAGYIALCEAYLGPDSLNPRRFRIGASRAYDIEAISAARRAAHRPAATTEHRHAGAGDHPLQARRPPAVAGAHRGLRHRAGGRQLE
jgi:deoxyribose-phosphate aldolase